MPGNRAEWFSATALSCGTGMRKTHWRYLRHNCCFKTGYRRRDRRSCFF
jgi:hypothetical protein